MTRRVRSLSVGDHAGSYNSNLMAAGGDVPEAAIQATYPRVGPDWDNLIEQQRRSRRSGDARIGRSHAQLPYPLEPSEKLGFGHPGSELSVNSGVDIPWIPVTGPYGDPHPRPSSGSRTTQSRNQTSSLNEPFTAEPPSSDSPAAPPYYRSDDPVLIFTQNAIREQFDDDPTIAVVAGGDTFHELVPMLAIRLVAMHKHEEPLKALFTMAIETLENSAEDAADLLKTTLEPYVKQTLEDMTVHRSAQEIADEDSVGAIRFDRSPPLYH